MYFKFFLQNWNDCIGLFSPSNVIAVHAFPMSSLNGILSKSPTIKIIKVFFFVFFFKYITNRRFKQWWSTIPPILTKKNQLLWKTNGIGCTWQKRMYVLFLYIEVYCGISISNMWNEELHNFTEKLYTYFVLFHKHWSM
jgi:hypothetical protein